MPSFITMASISSCNLTENKHGIYRSVARFRDPSHCYSTNCFFSSFCVVLKKTDVRGMICASPLVRLTLYMCRIAYNPKNLELSKPIWEQFPYDRACIYEIIITFFMKNALPSVFSQFYNLWKSRFDFLLIKMSQFGSVTK